MITKLEQMQQSGDFSELRSLLSENREALSQFLAAPVSLKTHKVYEIENYGSAMAPFYSTLSIWIGGIVLVAMMSVTVSDSTLEGLSGVKNSHLYFGRYILFFIMGLMQSTLIGLGDLLFLGIQCRHPFLFMLACWFSSIVYVNIIYTLTVSFGRHRKGDKRHPARDTGSGYRRHIPYRSCTDILQGDISAAAVHTQHGGYA